ncbi:MAG TPA: 16S rRNA (cytidine(1402)-2'-O)-methyltransferase [Acidobacteriota bacterium]|nr:16S rRNA (cytidine(1402)-2'-O)-methyltransferase [Acidobacteriota bacterium]
MNPLEVFTKGDPSAPLEPGLYMVATPIGNLEDITLRALRILSKCSLVAAEDTRRIRILLNNFEIKVKTVSYREQNRARATPGLLELIREGHAVALVSDAGMPCVSDPGAELVAACAEAGLPVFAVPGANAATGALSISGFPGDRFSFLGFPPAKSAARRKLLEEVSSRPEPLVFYEAPHRIVPSLRDMQEVLGDRLAVAAREMTKLHEERIAGRLSEIRDSLENRSHIRGEFTLVVAGLEDSEAADIGDAELRRRYLALLAEGVEPNEALRRLAAATGRRKRELYSLLRSEKEEEGE